LPSKKETPSKENDIGTSIICSGWTGILGAVHEIIVFGDDDITDPLVTLKQEEGAVPLLINVGLHCGRFRDAKFPNLQNTEVIKDDGAAIRMFTRELTP
jgi:hypothetical protein